MKSDLLESLPRFRLPLLAALLSLSASALAETSVFVNVNVVPMDTERVIAAQTVVVRAGRIERIGPTTEIAVPEGATVIDGTDRYLLPGLAEMHAHVTGETGFDRLATLFVANGVTTIRGMLGRPSHLPLRDALAANERFGPRLYTSGPSANGRSVSGAHQAAQLVRDQQQAGYNFIKVHPGLDAEEFAALANTANELGIDYAGHVPVAAGVMRALDLNMATIDHLDGYFASLLPPGSQAVGSYGGFFDVLLANEIDAKALTAIAEETAAAGTWNVPTQVLIEQLVDSTPIADLKNRAEMRFVDAGTLRQWEQSKRQMHGERGFDPEIAERAIALRRQLIFELQQAGAGLLLGSDAPQVFNVPGFSLHRELGILVAAGLTPYEALHTGTVAVAEFLQSNGGTVAVGRDADLVLLDANPLQDIGSSRRIRGVMLRGQWYSRRELDSRLQRYALR